MILLDAVYLAIIAVVTYLNVFNLMLWFENKNKFSEKKRRGKLPALSILIPAYNEEDSIGETIENLLKTNYPKKKLEIIVIDDGSKDKTCEIARRFKDKIKVLRSKHLGKAAALNFGLKHAKNDFVAVMDADTTLEKNALRNCVNYFEGEEVAAVTSHILLKQKNSFLQKLQHIEFMIVALTRKVRESLNLIDATPGPLSIYRKKILLELGGFDEKNLLEDVEIAWRLLRNGYKIKMAYDAMVYSNYPSSLKGWWKQRARWNMGGIQTLSKYLSCMFKRNTHMVGTFLVPVSLMNYIFGVVGVVALLYIFFRFLISSLVYAFGAISAGVNPFVLNLSYSIDMFTLYGAILVLMSLSLVKVSLSNHGEKVNLVTLVPFLTLYLFLFPPVLIYSIYKLVRRQEGWLTK